MVRKSLRSNHQKVSVSVGLGKCLASPSVPSPGPGGVVDHTSTRLEGPICFPALNPHPTPNATDPNPNPNATHLLVPEAGPSMRARFLQEFCEGAALVVCVVCVCARVRVWKEGGIGVLGTGELS